MAQTGPQEAGRLLVDQPHGLRDARHGGVHAAGHQRRRAADVQPRHDHRDALPPRRRDLRPRPPPRHRRLRRPRVDHAASTPASPALAFFAAHRAARACRPSSPRCWCCSAPGSAIRRSPIIGASARRADRRLHALDDAAHVPRHAEREVRRHCRRSTAASSSRWCRSRRSSSSSASTRRPILDLHEPALCVEIAQRERAAPRTDRRRVAAAGATHGDGREPRATFLPGARARRRRCWRVILARPGPRSRGRRVASATLALRRRVGALSLTLRLPGVAAPRARSATCRDLALRPHDRARRVRGLLQGAARARRCSRRCGCRSARARSRRAEPGRVLRASCSSSGARHVPHGVGGATC